MEENSLYLKQFNIYNIYSEEIIPILTSCEHTRKMLFLLEISIITLSVVSLLGLVVGIDLIKFFIPNISSSIPIRPLFLTIMFASCYIAIYIPNNYIKKINELCLPTLFKNNFKKYSQLNVFPDKEFKKSPICPYYERRLADDCFVGNYNGVNFFIFKTMLYYFSGPDLMCSFSGIILTINNKKIRNKATIINKKDLFNWKYSFYSAAKIKKNKYFVHPYNVYSPDRIDVQDVVTQDLIEKLQNLEIAYKTKYVRCSFYNDKIMLTIPARKNLFKIGSLWFSYKNKKYVNKLFEELHSIYQIVDYFTC